ncbi:Sugar fermentation stimulation protein A [Pontivivens insulae]|uniref:Sugar fermentation stimulation protein homolog n=2 Tax=Pontivivens insulae TaxID=1639689 RepID=A0A2R8A741_9RHOB|nr:sugar fermentation stimulation protein [Pontivivens insulae]SPF28005.1 Sugar fermentation stimulation protein A [Pontivivens insulae]
MWVGSFRDSAAGMIFDPPLQPATLLRRYKRFLADVILEKTGQEVTVHCANPGKMIGVAEPESRIWVQPATNPNRKLQWSWLLTELADGHLAGIDTGVPNRIVAEALQDRRIPAFADWPDIQAEVRYGERSRIDFRLSRADGSVLWVEVKNVHLRRTGTLAEFPDSVTARGAKHLDELGTIVEGGAQAAMLYVIQRTDCDHVTVAADFDPVYAAAMARAAARGVEFYAMGTEISTEGIRLSVPYPVILPDPS